MAFDFDFSQVPDDPTRIQDGERIAPGRGMVLIRAFREDEGAKGKAHEVEMEIVSWTVPSEVGKLHKENIFTKDTSGKGFPQKRMTCLFLAAGVFTADDVKKWKAAGSQPSIDTQKLVGRPVMIELVEVPDQNDAAKKYINIGNIGLAIYHIQDPRVKGWPVNQTIFNRCAAVVGNWVAPEKTAASKPAATANGNAPADPFAAVT